jgi:hypothetical protein
MEKENYKIYKLKANEIVAYLRTQGNKVNITYEPTKDDPQMTISVEGCKKWRIGIWAIGKWSEFYMTDRFMTEQEIAVFAIHTWGLDKFRYSSADWGYEMDASSEESIYRALKKIDCFVKHARKKPWEVLAQTTGLLGYEATYQSEATQKWKYWKAWYENEIRLPFKEWAERKGSCLMLWGILKVISYLDPRISAREKIDYGPCCWPRYTFSFLCRKDLDIDRVYSAWKFYSVWPEKVSRWLWLKKNIRLFCAHWCLADQKTGETEEEITRKMSRGIYFEEEDE